MGKSLKEYTISYPLFNSYAQTVRINFKLFNSKL